MKAALAETHPEDEHEHELSQALRTHGEVRRWWGGIGAALARGLEGSQLRTLLGFQIVLCGADAIFLQVALDNAADTPQPEDADRARAALSEAREIEAKAREWLSFISQPPRTPAAEQLAQGMAAHERGETVHLTNAIAEMRARRSS